MRHVEHGLQVAVARYLDLCLDPDLTWWSAIDHGAGKMSKAAAGMMKARGVKRGLPDIIIVWLNKMIGIELKARGRTTTAEQEEVGYFWSCFGFEIYVARSLEEVQGVLVETHAPMRHRMVLFNQRSSV